MLGVVRNEEEFRRIHLASLVAVASETVVNLLRAGRVAGVNVDVRNLHRVPNHGLIVEVVNNNHGVILLTSLRNKAKVVVEPNLRERLVRVGLQVLNGSPGGSANHSIRVVLEVTKVINQQDLAHGLAFPLNGWVVRMS
jgi:hypothetical protein